VNRPLKNVLPQAFASSVAFDSYTFNLCTGTTLIGQVGDEGELKRPNDFVLVHQYHQLLVFVSIDLLECMEVTVRNRILQVFSLLS
ncbi:MAG: hypothetical protein AAF551_14430, partial [Bacteroidota bacterium]